METQTTNIHGLIKTIRSEMGLTQKEFADTIESNRSNIAKYETGIMPPANVFLKILHVGGKIKKGSIPLTL